MFNNKRPKTDLGDHISWPSKRRKMCENDEKDRLSRLPNDVVQRILSLLSPREAFASRRLCKTWFLAWASDPILDFAENDIVPSPRSHGDLVGFANDTFLKLNDAELVRTLRLRLRMYGRRALKRIETWLRFAGERNVRVLDIDAVTTDIPFALPQPVLTSSSLFVLNLANLEIKISSSVSLTSLQSLSLSHVKFDGDETARRLISSSPSLKLLSLSFCFGAKTLRISNPNLTSLEVKHCSSRVVIEEARGVETLAYTGRAWAPESWLGGGAALEGLAALRLHVMSLGDVAAVEKLIARLPRLEELMLTWRGWARVGPRVIKIRGESLKYLVVDGPFCYNVEVVVDAPNLVCLEYDKDFVSVTCLNSPKLMMSA